MATFSEQLREHAIESRAGAKEMLEALSVRNSLSIDLLAMADADDMPGEHASRLRALADQSEQNDDRIPMIAAIVKSVTANFVDYLADLTDYLMAKGSLKIFTDKLRENRDFNAALRAAASAGNWELFNELATKWTDDGAKSGTGDGSGGGGTPSSETDGPPGSGQPVETVGSGVG